MNQKTYEKIIGGLHDDNENFTADLETTTITNDQLQHKLDLLLQQIKQLKIIQVVRMNDREITKNQILEDIENEIYLQDLDLARNTKEYIKATQEIELHLVNEINHLMDTLKHLLDTYIDYETELNKHQIKPEKILTMPASLPNLIHQHQTSTDPEEKQRILEKIRQLPDQQIIQQILKKQGMI